MQAEAPVAQMTDHTLEEIVNTRATTKPISPATHSLLDYLLLITLLIVPPMLRFPKSVINLYRAQVLVLFGYVAVTDQPLAVKPLIPFPLHGKVDTFNIATFTLQSFLKGFREDKRALIFNIIFTAATAISVFLTDWNGDTKKRGASGH